MYILYIVCGGGLQNLCEINCSFFKRRARFLREGVATFYSTPSAGLKINVSDRLYFSLPRINYKDVKLLGQNERKKFECN